MIKLKSVSLAVVIGSICCQSVFALPHPANGVQREYHPNGKVRLETVFKKGYTVRTRTFYENVRLQSEFRYKNKAMERARTFYEDGQIRSEWSRTEGVMRFYSSTGALTQQSSLKEYNL